MGAALSVVVSLLSPVRGRLPMFPLSPATEDPEWQFTCRVSLLRERFSLPWCRCRWADNLDTENSLRKCTAARRSEGSSFLAH